MSRAAPILLPQTSLIAIPPRSAQIGDPPGPCGCWKPQLYRMRTRFVSVGIRPEHVETPDAFKVSSFGRGFSTVVPAGRREKLRM